MSFLAPSTPSLPPVPPPTPAPTREDPEVEEARRREIVRARNERGRRATLLSGQSGGGAEQRPLQRKTLLGE